MPTYYTPDYTFTYAYDPAPRCVHARWHGTVPDADLYAHYAELMATAEANGHCRWWLLDVRARNWPSSSFRHWMNAEFAPLAKAALGEPLFLAFVVGDGQYENTSQLDLQKVQNNLVGHDVQPGFFESEAAASAWLVQQQAHDPAA